MTRSALHRRLALAAAAAGAGVLIWRVSEAAAARIPALFVTSGVGLGAFIVGSILLAGAAMQARASGQRALVSDAQARPALTKALYAGIASTLITLGAAVLVTTVFSGPAAPLDLILAAGAGGFLLTFAHGHNRLAQSGGV